jgi:hypothetical protein
MLRLRQHLCNSWQLRKCVRDLLVWAGLVDNLGVGLAPPLLLHHAAHLLLSYRATHHFHTAVTAINNQRTFQLPVIGPKPGSNIYCTVYTVHACNFDEKIVGANWFYVWIIHCVAWIRAVEIIYTIFVDFLGFPWQFMKISDTRLSIKCSVKSVSARGPVSRPNLMNFFCI